MPIAPRRGARLAFGSDWSVAPLNPLLGIDAAVNRRTLDGKHPEGWFPAQKIRVAEAIEAYTLGAAYAAFQEKDAARWKWASSRIWSCSRETFWRSRECDRIAETAIVMTIVGGKIVYEKRK